MIAVVLGALLASATATPAAAAPAADAPPDRSAPPKPTAPKPFAIVTPTDFKLKNGLRVLYIERKRAPVVDVVATVDAGIVEDPAELPGLAGWTAGLLTEGAGDMDSIAYSDAQNAIGAQIGSGAEPEAASMYLHVSSAKAAEGLKLFATGLLQPRFDDKEWQRVRQQVFGYFMYQSNEPQELAALAGGRANWGKDSRLGVDLAGTPKALVAVKTSDMKAFYAAHYRPDTTTLVVVGDIDKKTLDKLLQDDFGAWTATGKAPTPSKLAGPLALSARTVVAVDVPGAAQTVLRVQNPAAADIKPYTPDVSVMNMMLGVAFTSRLNSNLREKNHYSYGAGSHLVLFKNGNAFVATAPVATAVTGPALTEMLKELKNIHDLAPA
ncbi:MAG TPA: pitrilysin family protein, partial [Myxococcota bacterium]